MSSPTQDGFELKRSRRGWWILGGAAFVVLIAVVVILNVTKSDAKSVGTRLEVAWDSNPQEEQIINYVAKNIAPDYGLTIVPREFGDANAEYRAIDEHAVPAAISAQRWWMLTQNQELGLNLLPTDTYVFLWASGIFSLKYKSVDDLPDGAKIEIPQEPSVQAQQLGVLASLGLVKLDPKVSPLYARLKDVIANPKHLKITPIALNSQARVLKDFDATFACQFCQQAGYGDKQIGSVGLPSWYSVPVTIAADRKDDPNIKKLLKAFGDPRLQTWLKNAPASFKQVVLPRPDKVVLPAITEAPKS
jgi:ABC-type metal ion transport system substrate-binding protein